MTAPPDQTIIYDDDLPRDTNARQRMATDPDLSVWVSASAGTGKTTVLTRRVLRLLLPRPDGRAGTLPQRILCLTFTKAAASEMKLRLTTTLSQWATLPDDSAAPDQPSLRQELTNLLGHEPRDFEMEAARRLFAAVVDVPGGLKIMTIHAFCTAILGTFPLEAGLPPQFATLEDAPAAALMTRARNEILSAAQRDPAGTLAQALQRIATVTDEDSFNSLLRAITSERAQTAQTLGQHGGADGLYAALCRMMDVRPDEDETAIIAAACADGAFDEGALRACCAALAGSKNANDNKRGESIQLWLDTNPSKRMDAFSWYQEIFLTQKFEVKAERNLATKDAAKTLPDIHEIMTAEGARLIAVRERMNAAHCAAMTRDLFTLAGAITGRYADLKDARAALDFDDLIQRSLALLRAQDIVPWVMYKLDGGIDHILVDEAQDTNSEQWEIIRLLAADFFSGTGAREDVRRTIFAVGDEKQSIYSFQRAAPEKFAAMRHAFRAMVMAAGLPWRDIPLDMSFRTVPAVLRTVDETFAPPEMRAGMGLGAGEGAAPLRHYSSREGQGGQVELWPLFISPPEDKDDLWDAPVTAGESHRAAAHMARHIAATIGQWLDPANPAMLPAKGRPIAAGDIMILVRARSAFVNQLIRALKVAHIPVGGVDRMVLSEQLVVRDMRAVAQAVLLPADDLTLACVLKSPFIGWTDADLENLAAPRSQGQTLWDALQKHGGQAAEWLAELQTQTALHPFEFFSNLAQKPCPADPISGQHAITGRLGLDALDPLEELLNTALSFEDGNIPALPAFVHWLGQQTTDLKRAQEEAGASVRIMTVHGSKGLQAPIVILPDTVRTKRSGGKGAEKLLWPDKSGLALPLWAPKTDRAAALWKRGSAAWQDRMDEEYRRLLYVAMTRAEDRLIVAGYRNKRAEIEESWYRHVARAFTTMGADVQSVPFEYPAALAQDDYAPIDAQIIVNPQTAAPRKKDAPSATAALAIKPDDPALRWLYRPPAPEPLPPQPLVPSRVADALAADEAVYEPAIISPLLLAQPDGAADTAPSPAAQRQARMMRGTMLHRLLQVLPDIAAPQRRAAAENWLARQARSLQPAQAALAVDEIMAVLDHPDYAPLFAVGTLAEVPVTGIVGGKLVSGQIDRLAVRADSNEVWIIDYKTNREAPPDDRAIPPLYRRQMAAYAAVIGRIYPERQIRCFLLWTAGARIMEVSD